MSAKTKTCTKCKEKRKIEEFSKKNSKRNDEPRAICKICDRKSNVERRRRIAAGQESTSRPSGGKACQSCKQHKPLSGFPMQGKSHRDSCKTCYAREVEAVQIAEKNASKKKCGKCGKVKPIDGFAKDASTATGYRSACRECLNRDRRERNERQKRDGRRKVSKPQEATPRVISRATRKKKVVIVTMKVPDDKLGMVEADAHRYALRQLVQKHSAEYENLRLNFEATNGKYLTTLVE